MAKTKGKGQSVSTAGDMPIKPEDSTSTTSSGEASTPDTSGQEAAGQSNSAAPVTTGQPGTELSRQEYERSLVFGSLPQNVAAACQKILTRIHAARDFSKVMDNRTLFELAEELISFKAWVVTKKLLYESMYREKRASYIRGGSSAAAAEQEAKVSPEYRAYKYVESVYNLCEDQVMLVKKFKDDMAVEFRSS